eukprot:SAG11_NODE_19498_length_465_cov_1.275956_1_plen_25_part_10
MVEERLPDGAAAALQAGLRVLDGLD